MPSLPNQKPETLGSGVSLQSKPEVPDSLFTNKAYSTYIN